MLSRALKCWEIYNIFQAIFIVEKLLKKLSILNHFSHSFVTIEISLCTLCGVSLGFVKVKVRPGLLDL